jgi:phosphoribosylformylglycinamidine synthase
LTVRSLGADPRARDLVAAAAQLGLDLGDADRVTVADLVLVDGPLAPEHLDALTTLLVDPLLQEGDWSEPTGGIEVLPHPGVTDAGATAVLHAAATLGIPVEHATTGRRVEFGPEVPAALADEVVRRLVANPVVDHWWHGPARPVRSVDVPVTAAETVPMRGLDDDGLAALDRSRGLALDPAELRVIRDHFADLGRDPTDVELETLAQTWSEHCAHKTFRARIVTDDGTEHPSLLGRLRETTDRIDAPFVRSAFVGNAGIVSFVPGTTVAVKAETHNHPSAVEPFGGANTGVGGVIRDVLGAAHRPVAVTDVLCFGPVDLPLTEVPEGSLHPSRIRAGVVDGVADYGNKIGLPTVAGAVLYHPGYTTNPLVFAGCIGTAPERAIHDGPFPGDRVVVLGGRTGRDGIRGATFSSATMDATTGDVAGASVQIGDPITEKLLIDVLVGAEDLYTAITDCGAGGLSSAVGEMAEGVGALVELDRVPRKYPGLAPWEVWLSEAQERMVVAVDPARLADLAARCDRHGVELADLGHFTGDGRLVVTAGGVTVLDLDTGFLHDGRPGRTMRAELPRPDRSREGIRTVDEPVEVLLELLAHPDIASKAEIIRRYDHEIRGTTVVRPLVGPHHDAPADGVVLAEPTDDHGLAIGIGVAPWVGLHDPERMGRLVVDEAIRNVVVAGADPDRVALLDNFSWGDPRRASTLGDLAATVDGACAAALAFGAPFVSGKDSLNNEYLGADGRRHAVPPTLVVTAVAHVPAVDRCLAPDGARPGDIVVLLGPTRAEFAGSHLDLLLGEPTTAGPAPEVDDGAPARYRRFHRAVLDGLVRAAHDVSEGGLAVALAELCLAARLGLRVDVLPHPDPSVALFAESGGRLLAVVAADRVDEFAAAVGDALVLGEFVDQYPDERLTLPGLDPVPLTALLDAFTGGRS